MRLIAPRLKFKQRRLSTFNCNVHNSAAAVVAVDKRTTADNCTGCTGCRSAVHHLEHLLRALFLPVISSSSLPGHCHMHTHTTKTDTDETLQLT